jgi:hypothetical protein
MIMFWERIKRAFGFYERPSEQDKVVILTTLWRIRRNRFLSQPWLKNYIIAELSSGSQIEARLSSRVEKLSELVNLSVIEDYYDSVDRDESYFSKLGFNKIESKEIARALTENGLFSYGIPMKDLVQNDRLIMPFLYYLATQRHKLTERSKEDVKGLTGVYKLFCKRAGSSDKKFIEMRLLCVLFTNDHGTSPRADTRPLDGRGIAIEFSRNGSPRISVRRGVFVPFDTFNLLLLASAQRVEDAFAGFFTDQALQQFEFAPEADGYFNVLSMRKRSPREIIGTYQLGDKIGRFYGYQLEERIDPELLGTVGTLTEDQVRELPAHEQKEISQIDSLLSDSRSFE